MVKESVLTAEQKEDLERRIKDVLEQQEVCKNERDELKERRIALVTAMHVCQQSQYEYGDYIVIVEPKDSLKFSKKK